MNDEVRIRPQLVEEDVHITNVPAGFRTLADEVNKRAQKQKVTPQAIAQRLAPAEFNTAIVHFYRGEVQRSNVWRNRLDATTNWAVITAGATLSFVFSSPDNPHFAIPINTLLVSIFLFMEARRYRYYEVWANRVRVLETGYFAPMLSQQTAAPDKEWAEHISADLISPHFTISLWEALGRRLRSNYLWIFILLGLAWMLKVYIHPSPIPTTTDADRKLFWDIVFRRAAVGPAPGWLVVTVGVLFNALVIFVAFSTSKLRDASSEMLPLESFDWHPLKQVSDWAESNLKRRNTIRRSKKTRQRVRSVHRTDD
ncbi:MAG: DUF2270 domain-containing protein [Chloracidobacterium sp.]|nr:DUF2270 domain-containing protein [Chloracidobacterium sp.]MCC6824662.1 DUF2270 domain-containing protein [Acidobacteriota bacterium]MCO5332794.1 DUF2270 domain-containing protein [Pyrinomonadaceae bacterium]